MSDQETKTKKKVGGKVVRTDRKNYRERPSNVQQWRRASETTHEEEIDEAEQCVICAERIEFAALSPCSHTTCHLCTFRQRALYHKDICLVCRTENSRIIISEDIHKKYDEVPQSALRVFNDEYGIDFTSEVAAKATLNLLELICPMKHCKEHHDRFIFKNFKALNEHVKTAHDKQFCDICALNKKAFVSELKLYYHDQLQRHKSKGDEDGFKGHPLCQFCTGKRFYSDDELFIHLREKHEKCHVCDQIDASNPQYFRNYEKLSEHFRDQHYVCNVQTCLDQKFVVFMDEFDLKAHMLKEHKNIFGGDKNLLSIGRIGYSSPRRNGFGSQLSTVAPVTNNNNNSTNNTQPRQNRLPKGFRDDEGEVDSVELKKMRLEERARHYLNYNAASVEKFKELNKKYENYKLEADDLMKEYQEIFSTTSASDLQILVFEFSELFEANSLRRKRLVEASQKLATKTSAVVEERFPALPGSSGHTFHGSWNASNTAPKTNGRRAINGDSNFPALPAAGTPVTLSKNVISYNTTIPKSNFKKVAVIKRNTATPNYDFRPSYLSGTTTPKKAASPTPLNESKFPALPTKVIKKPPRVNPIRTDSGVWGQESSAESTPTASNSSSALDLNSLSQSLPATGNKKKNKKQMLFHVGI